VLVAGQLATIGAASNNNRVSYFGWMFVCLLFWVLLCIALVKGSIKQGQGFEIIKSQLKHIACNY
jgi:hypothetical protein